MTEHYEIIYSPIALDDLKSIYSYIALNLKEKGIAAKQVSRIQKHIRGLESLPARFALVEWEPWSSMGMHKMPVGNYVVYYLIEDQAHTVSIVRIFYGGRDVENIIRDGME
jgi:plasmid stabilization system protein ParE